MSHAGSSSLPERFPIFDGNDYSYWQQRMRIRLQAIKIELWEIVENGFTIAHPELPTQEEEINIQLDSQARDIICDSLSRNVFIRVCGLSTAKKIWNELKTIHEGIVQRSDGHIEMLRGMFARFRSLRGESVMELTDRLSSIVDRL